MEGRPFRNLVVILVIAALLSWMIPIFRRAPVIALALVAVVVMVLVSRRARGGRPLFRGGGFLCDSCKFNDPRYCRQPERPNATACPDFKPR